MVAVLQCWLTNSLQSDHIRCAFRVAVRVDGSPRFVGLVNGKECYMEKM